MRRIAVGVSIVAICLSLCSCTAFLGAASTVAGWLGSSSNSNSGYQIDTNLKAQNGDNTYKASGADNKADDVSGDQTGRDKNQNKSSSTNSSQNGNQNNYQANTITIQKDSFWEMLIALIIGVIITIFIFWMLPQHPQKFARWVKQKLIRKDGNNA